MHFGVKESNPVPMVLSLHRKIKKKNDYVLRNSKNDNDSFLSLSSSAINFHHFLIKENNSLIHSKSVKGF